MNATQILERQLSQQEMAERWRAHQAAMGPWIKQCAKVMGMLMPNAIMHSDGRLETVYTEKDQAIIDDLRSLLQEISGHTLKSLGLATPPGDG